MPNVPSAAELGHPQLLVYSPTKDAASVARGSRLYLTFAKPIVAGSGNLVLRNDAGDDQGDDRAGDENFFQEFPLAGTGLACESFSFSRFSKSSRVFLKSFK